jgi:hypothetical protein
MSRNRMASRATMTKPRATTATIPALELNRFSAAATFHLVAFGGLPAIVPKAGTDGK